MNYLSQSIENARLQAAEDDFNQYHGGSYPEEQTEKEEKEEEPEDNAQGLVFVGRTFENVPQI